MTHTGIADAGTAPSRQWVRALAAWNVVGGTVLLVRPRAVPAVVGGASPPAGIARVLGARQLTQGALTAARPDDLLVLAGVAADVAHSVSMLAAAAIWRRYRRSALTSAGFAAVSAALGSAALRAAD